MNQPKKLGLFCKTFKDDLPLLFHALQSFRQNWTDKTEILIVAEPDCQPEIDRWAFPNTRTVYVQPWPCGYCHAMATKLCADLYLRDCRLILLFDSDMLLMRPTGLTDLMPDCRPSIVYDVWHSDLDPAERDVSWRVWGPAVRRSMGVDLDRDFMVEPCWLYWSSTFQGAREMIESHRQMPFGQAVYCNYRYEWTKFMDHPMKLCDMQALGVYAFRNEQHLYRFEQRTAASNCPIRQNWSHAISQGN